MGMSHWAYESEIPAEGSTPARKVKATREKAGQILAYHGRAARKTSCTGATSLLPTKSGIHVISGPPAPARVLSHLGDESFTVDGEAQEASCSLHPLVPMSFHRVQSSVDRRRSYTLCEQRPSQTAPVQRSNVHVASMRWPCIADGPGQSRSSLQCFRGPLPSPFFDLLLLYSTNIQRVLVFW